MDIFETLASEELETIAQLLRERRLVEGEELCRQGEAGDALFIVTGGRIKLSTGDPSGNEKVLTYFTDGQFFGEMALLTGAPRSATATAEADSQVLVLAKHDFDELLATHPQIMREMLKVVSQRTLQTNQQLLADEPGGAVAVGAGKVYAVFSPRGGSGKTLVATNLAVGYARDYPERAALLDLSLTFGHVAPLLGLTPPSSLAGVPAESLEHFDRRTLSTYLLEHASTLKVLVAGTRPEEGEAVTAAHVRAALSAMKRQFAVSIVDCGSSFDEPTIAALELADKVIVLCAPELNSLRDVRECQRVFGEIIHLDKDRLCFVLNQPQPYAALTRVQFETALEQEMLMELPHAGESASKAAARSEALVAAAPGSAFTRAIAKLAATLTPPEPRAARARFGRVAPVQTNAHARPSAEPKKRSLLGLFRAK
jgi:CRP-like cAMP-binding protein